MTAAAAPLLPPHATLVVWEGAFVDAVLQPRPNRSSSSGTVDCAAGDDEEPPAPLPLPPVFDYHAVLAWPSLLLPPPSAAAASEEGGGCPPHILALSTSLAAAPYHERMPAGKTHYDVMPGGVRYTAALALIEALYAAPSAAHALRFGVPALLWLLEHGPADLRVLLPRNSTAVDAALDTVGVARLWGAWRRGRIDTTAAAPASVDMRTESSWRDIPALVEQEPAPALYWAYRAFIVLDGTGAEARGAGSSLPLGPAACPGEGAEAPALCDATRQWSASLAALLPPPADKRAPSCVALADAPTLAWLRSDEGHGGAAFRDALETDGGLRVLGLDEGATLGEVPRALLWLLAGGSAPAEVAFAHAGASVAWVEEGDSASLISTQSDAAGVVCGRVRQCWAVGRASLAAAAMLAGEGGPEGGLAGAVARLVHGVKCA